MLYYLPGCDVRKNHPEAIDKIEQYMLKKGATIAQCCRTKQQLLKEGDTIVHNCTMCQLILDEVYPNNQCLSLYEYILNDQAFPFANHHQQAIIIQDCWRMKNHQNFQKAIRECLKQMNFHIIEMPDCFEKTRFCGVWRYNALSPDCIELAPQTFQAIQKDIHLLPQEKQIEKMKQWVQRYHHQKVVVYCNGCEKGIRLGQGECWHMVELLAQGL